MIDTKPERLDLEADPDTDLTVVINRLRDGGLIAYPTETVYGLGGGISALAVSRVRELKGGRTDKPLIALVESKDAVAQLSWTEAARELADVLWPGAVTLVLEDPSGIFPQGIREEATGRVGVRVSPHPLISRLLKGLGGALPSTSLNAPGEPPVSSGSAASDVLRQLGAKDVIVLDSGTLRPSRPSTVVDCTGPLPVVLREGSVSIERLRYIIPEIYGQESD